MRPAINRWITCLCIVLVMAVPVLVRLSAAGFPEMTEAERGAYTNEQGKYYMTDMDSYYHVRLVDTHLRTGSIGDAAGEDGGPVDTRSFWPEGQKAHYPMGIVLLTETVWKVLHAVFGTDLYDVEYSLSAVMSALAGLAAFLLIRRISGRAGGVAGGILTACAPAYVLRTTFSRFDTDMFAVLMDVMLILLLTEALRAKTKGRRIGFAAGFTACAWIYSQCWNAAAVLLMTGITLFGALAAVIWNLLAGRRGGQETGRGSRYREAGMWTVLGCGIAAPALMFLTEGKWLISSLTVTASTVTGTGAMPSLFTLISEMNVPSFFPKTFPQWFWDPHPGGDISVLTGIGGFGAALAALGGGVWLILQGTGAQRFRRSSPLDPEESRTYAGILLAALGGWAFLARYGFRFVEHLAVPAGILAGCAVGWIGRNALQAGGKARWIRRGLSAALALAAAVPAAGNAVGMITGLTPSVSRVSEEAMEWVRDHAEDPDAVIATWWDNGYFYEAVSGHPCLWDGGIASSPVRAILVSKALTAHDPELSRRILLMLSGSGNAGAEYLLERTDAETAFDTVWDALLLDRPEAEELIAARCGMERAEAAAAERLLHPAPVKETYLIATDLMMMEIGWFEYYAGWDFAGDNPLPRSTTLRYTPEGDPYDSPRGQAYMEEVRGPETLWRLYMEEEEDPRFELVFQGDDGTEGLMMWRVVPEES